MAYFLKTDIYGLYMIFISINLQFYLAPSPSSDADATKAERRKKRKSRWGDDIHNKTYIPGMPTVIPKGMNRSQEEQYLGL